MTRPWRTFVLVYRSVDAGYRHGGRILPAARTMSDRELEVNWRVLERVPAAVEEWSEGNASMRRYDMHLASGPVRHLTDVGDERYWVAPEDCRDVLDERAPRGRYDCVIVCWPAVGDMPLCGWGCSTGPNEAAHGAAYSACISEDRAGHAMPEENPEGFVHEWLHQVEGTFREMGMGPDVFPGLHDAGHLSSCRPEKLGLRGTTYGEHNAKTGTWVPWYRDYMTGQVRRPDGDGCFGLAREVWDRR